MIVVTSILSGEFTTTRTPRRRKGSSNKKKPPSEHQPQPKPPSHSFADERSETAASSDDDEDRGREHDSANNSTLQGDNNGGGTDAFSAAGSTCLGDSFVLAIDWGTTTADVGPSYYHDVDGSAPKSGGGNGGGGTVANHGLNESLEDPYLPPVESVRRRLCAENERAGESPSFSLLRDRARSEAPLPERAPNARAVRSGRSIRGGSEPEANGAFALVDPNRAAALPNPADRTSPSVRSLGSFAMPSSSSDDAKLSPTDSLRSFKSLGTYEFPAAPDFDETVAADVEDAATFDSNRPFASVTAPHPVRFEQHSFTTVLEDEEEDNDGDTIHDESFTIPTTPMLTTTTPSRRRRHAALQRVKELKADLDRCRRQSTGGRNQMGTARLYLELGRTEQRARLYPAAINSFFQAAAIFRHVARPAALATALDHAAVAYCQAHEDGVTGSIHPQHKVSRFYRCLYEALLLRKQELGPWHVDTVDTLQHLAQLCLLTGHAARAAGHYLEVVHLRKAIFGPDHPGTAVTAHGLGNAYLQSHDTVAAELWYDHALAVYNAMHLPSDNPAVTRLLRDRKRLERVDRWMDEDPAADENLLFEL